LFLKDVPKFNGLAGETGKTDSCLVDPGGAVFEAKFMLPSAFSEEAAAEKQPPQLQHNMWVANARSAVLSVNHRWRQMG
jgi:hypothetical protein